MRAAQEAGKVVKDLVERAHDGSNVEDVLAQSFGFWVAGSSKRLGYACSLISLAVEEGRQIAEWRESVDHLGCRERGIDHECGRRYVVVLRINLFDL